LIPPPPESVVLALGMMLSMKALTVVCPMEGRMSTMTSSSPNTFLMIQRFSTERLQCPSIQSE